MYISGEIKLNFNALAMISRININLISTNNDTNIILFDIVSMK